MRLLLFGGRLSERQVRSDIQHDKDADHPKRERSAMRHQKIQRCVAIQNGQDSLDPVAQAATQQDSQHKRPDRDLKYSLSQNEWLERQRWWKYCRKKNAQKSILLHPVLDFCRLSSSVPMKKCFTAFFRQQVQPDASRDRTESSHRHVIRHSLWSYER